MRQEVRFAAGGIELAGELSVRDDAGECPALVFVHGSGPATKEDWEQETGYLVEAGVATLAYDKPGCGGSTGDWREQSFDDRAAEALAALRFVRRDPRVDSSWSGLFGASQGGWIAPMAAASSDEVSFVIAASASGVSPREQDRFRVEHALRSAGFDPHDVEHALATWKERDRRLRSNEAAAAILETERRVQNEDGPSRPGRTAQPDHHLRVEPDAAWGSAALPLVADWIRSRAADASG